MASRICGWCGRLVHIQRHGSAVLSSPTDDQLDPDDVTITGAYRCAHCGRMSLAYLDSSASRLYSSDDRALFGELEESDRTRWLPRRGSAPTYPDVPEHIASAAVEAHECHSIGAHRSTVQMARAVIEATAKAKGITTGPLIAKIDQLDAQRIIRPTVAAGCHEVRHLGNDVAHGDFLTAVTAEEADEVMVLMDILLDDVFQAEARVSRMMTARQARSQRPPAEAG